MSKRTSQHIKVDCYLELYEDASLIDTFNKVSETVGNNKWFTEWLDVDMDDGAIHLSGETDEDVYFTPGSPATWWEPAEPDEFDGMIELDELEDEIKTMLDSLKHEICDIDFYDMKVDAEEELYQKLYEEPEYEPDEDYYRG